MKVCTICGGPNITTSQYDCQLCHDKLTTLTDRIGPWGPPRWQLHHAVRESDKCAPRHELPQETISRRRNAIRKVSNEGECNMAQTRQQTPLRDIDYVDGMKIERVATYLDDNIYTTREHGEFFTTVTTDKHNMIREITLHFSGNGCKHPNARALTNLISVLAQTGGSIELIFELIESIDCCKWGDGYKPHCFEIADAVANYRKINPRPPCEVCDTTQKPCVHSGVMDLTISPKRTEE